MTPDLFIIFAIGVFVTAVTLVGAVLIGLDEAADSDHARARDLTSFERKLVDREHDG